VPLATTRDGNNTDTTSDTLSCHRDGDKLLVVTTRTSEDTSRCADH